VTPISVKVMRHGRSMVRQQHQPGVLRLGNVGEEIKPSVVVDQERLGVTLLRSNVIGTLEGVSLEVGAKKDGWDEFRFRVCE
jgi:hypothetical protein